MNKILITGHGKYAEGLLSAISLIYGDIDNVLYINFLGDDTETYTTDLERMIDKDVVVVFTDIIGGTPFNQSVKIINEVTDRVVFVVGGANLALMIDILLYINNSNINREEILRRVENIQESVKMIAFER